MQVYDALDDSRVLRVRGVKNVEDNQVQSSDTHYFFDINVGPPTIGEPSFSGVYHPLFNLKHHTSIKHLIVVETISLILLPHSLLQAFHPLFALKIKVGVGKIQTRVP